MADRALGRDEALHCRLWPRTLLAAGAVLAPVMAASGALGQSLNPELYDPSFNAGSGAQSFRQNLPVQPIGTRRFRRVLSAGNAPPPGAGTSGFVSTGPPPGVQDIETSSPVAPALPTPSAVEPLLSEAPGAVVSALPERRRTPTETEDPYEPLGLRAGSFIVKPAIEVSGGYDSNPERDTPARGSAVLTVSPELHVRSDWSRHEFRADLQGQYRSYPGFTAVPSIDRPFVDSRLAGRIDVTRRTRIDLEGRFRLATDDPNSPDLPAGLAHLPITMSGGLTTGVAHRFNRLELGVSGIYDRSVYEASKLTNGATVSNDDRNYDQYGAKLRGSYEIVPGVKPFVELGGDRRVHDLPVDSFGLRRDSTGYEARVGTTVDLTQRLVGTLSGGYATRDYVDPRLSELGGILADASLVWSATPLTNVTFTARSRLAESALNRVSGVLRRDFGGQIDHAFRRWLIGTVKFEYGTDDYVGSSREDQRYALSGMLTYKMSRNWQLKGEVRRQWLTSNVRSAEYIANIYLLGIRWQQ